MKAHYIIFDTAVFTLSLQPKTMYTNLLVAHFGIIHNTPSIKMKFHWTKQGFPCGYAGALEFRFNNYENSGKSEKSPQ